MSSPNVAVIGVNGVMIGANSARRMHQCASGVVLMGREWAGWWIGVSGVVIGVSRMG